MYWGIVENTTTPGQYDAKALAHWDDVIKRCDKSGIVPLILVHSNPPGVNFAQREAGYKRFAHFIEMKFRGVGRLIWVLCIPFLTVFGFVVYYRVGIAGWAFSFDMILYSICSLLSIGIYLPLAAWLSLAIGLRVRSQMWFIRQLISGDRTDFAP